MIIAVGVILLVFYFIIMLMIAFFAPYVPNIERYGFIFIVFITLLLLIPLVLGV